MITKVHISDPSKTPIPYLMEIKEFSKDAEWEFKSGVNVIVGKNGSGKSTLLNLIKKYMLVVYEQTEFGVYGNNLNGIIGNIEGADVYADYKKTVFNLSTPDEQQNREFSDAAALAQHLSIKASSYGESVLSSLGYLFKIAFSPNTKVHFDYTSEYFQEYYPRYVEYVRNHTVECPDEWTFLLDEPDKNLDITNINEIYNILKTPKEQVQLIVVIHNPIVIYKLMKKKSVNFIEMTPGYLDSIQKVFEKL